MFEFSKSDNHRPWDWAKFIPSQNIHNLQVRREKRYSEFFQPQRIVKGWHHLMTYLKLLMFFMSMGMGGKWSRLDGVQS